MPESLRHSINIPSAFFTCIVVYNVSATPDEPPPKTLDEVITCVLTCLVISYVSAAPDEPLPKTLDEFITCVFDIYCSLQCISEAR